MEAAIVSKSSKWPRIRRWALVGGLLGLLFTLAFVGFAYLVPDDVDPLFMLNLHIILTFPTMIISRVFGWKILSMEQSHQINPLLQLLLVSLVNSLLLAVLGGLIAFVAKPVKGYQQIKQ